MSESASLFKVVSGRVVLGEQLGKGAGLECPMSCQVCGKNVVTSVKVGAPCSHCAVFLPLGELPKAAVGVQILSESQLELHPGAARPRLLLWALCVVALPAYLAVSVALEHIPFAAFLRTWGLIAFCGLFAKVTFATLPRFRMTKTSTGVTVTDVFRNKEQVLDVSSVDAVFLSRRRKRLSVMERDPRGAVRAVIDDAGKEGAAQITAHHLGQWLNVPFLRAASVEAKAVA
jgi:hypothetical protein